MLYNVNRLTQPGIEMRDLVWLFVAVLCVLVGLFIGVDVGRDQSTHFVSWKQIEHAEKYCGNFEGSRISTLIFIQTHSDGSYTVSCTDKGKLTFKVSHPQP